MSKLKKSADYPVSHPKPPLNSIEGGFTSIDIKFDIFYRGFHPNKYVKSGQLYPYREAKLYDKGGAITKRWYVEWKVWNKDSSKLMVQRQWISSQDFPTAIARKRYGNKYVAIINKLLREGHYYSAEEIREKNLPKSTELYNTLIEEMESLLPIMEKQLRKSSVINYKYTLKDFRNYLIDIGKVGMVPAEINQPMIIAFLDWSQTVKESFNNRSRNNRLSFIRPLFTRLVKKGVIEKNPASNIGELKETEAKHIAFSDHDIATIKSAVLKEFPDLWLFICFIYYGFIRPNEVRQLKIRDINLASGMINVDAHIAKNRSSKKPTISKAFKKVLLSSEVLKYPSNYYIFSKKGLPGTKMVGKNYYATKHRKILNDLGYDREYTLYGWKHTGNVKAVLAGINLYDIKKQNGHASLEETDNYLRSLNAIISSDIQDKQQAI